MSLNKNIELDDCKTEETNQIPSNDEIINNLTRDLESHCVDSEDDQAKGDYKIPSDFEKSESDEEKEDAKPSIPDDFIDEEILKDIDAKLSDEEKTKKKLEAEELKVEGNEKFKAKMYIESIDIYTKALRICPLKYNCDRSILYCNRAAAKITLDRKESAIDDCSKAIELNDKYIRAYLRRAKLYEDSDKLDDSLEDYKKVLELNPRETVAIDAVRRLPDLIKERNEKLKEEMLGKLKDLGNMILRPFGLSTENFNMQQDPNTGSYSVNFQQNAK